MILKFVPNETSFGFNQVNMFIVFEEKDFKKFRENVSSSEETYQSAQFTDDHIWKMWALRKNYHVHKCIRQLYDKTSTQILIDLEDKHYNDRRKISINSFLHSTDNHEMYCQNEACTIYHWLELEPETSA